MTAFPARTFLIALLALLPAAGLAEGPGAKTTLAPADKKLVQDITREYLLANPEFLMSVMQALKAKDERAAEQTRRQSIKAQRKQLLDDPASPTLGNANGDVTIVEFFDYSCPYCRQVEPSLERMLSDDAKLRIVHKQLPILGPASVLAARVALVAKKAGKHPEFHRAMMKLSNKLDERTVIETAQSVGLTLDLLKAEVNSNEVTEALQRDIALARLLDVRSTPGFVIGDELISGAADLSTLLEFVDEARMAQR